jgi:arylsulfatase A-like enzyme
MDKKNIVLIVADTARAANFPFYGYDRNTAPFLAELAEEGILYNDVYSQSIWTLPSHTSIFTGEYSFEHKTNSAESFLEENPLIEELSQKGYTNICLSNNAYISSEFGWDEEFDYFKQIREDRLFVSKEEDPIWDKMRDLEDKIPTKKKYMYFLKHCVKNWKWKELVNAFYMKLNDKFWIGDQGARNTNKIAKSRLKETKEPFFLFINYIEAHSPYKPPRSYKNEFTSENITREQYDKFFQNSNYKENAINGNLELSNQDLELQKAFYDAEIKYLDKRVQELYNYLDEEEYLEDTVFIFTSDHGEYFGEHGLHRHAGGLEKEVLEVPLIIKHPDKESDEKRGCFELKQLYNYISKIASGKMPDLEEKEYALSEYYLWLGGEQKVDQHWKNYQCSIQDENGIFVLDHKENSRCSGQINEEKFKEFLEKQFRKPLSDPFNHLPRKEDEVDKKVKNQLEKLGYNV